MNERKKISELVRNHEFEGWHLVFNPITDDFELVPPRTPIEGDQDNTIIFPNYEF